MLKSNIKSRPTQSFGDFADFAPHTFSSSLGFCLAQLSESHSLLDSQASPSCFFLRPHFFESESQYSLLHSLSSAHFSPSSLASTLGPVVPHPGKSGGQSVPPPHD